MTALFAERYATWRLLVGAFAISFSAVFVKLVSVPATTSAIYRVVIGGAVLAVWLARQRRLFVPARRALLALLWGALFFALDLATWHQSIVYIGPGLATLLGNFQVFFMALAAVLIFKERLSPATIASIPMAVVGLALITGFQWSGLPRDTQLGLLLGLATAVSYTGFMLFMRRAQQVSKRPDSAADLAFVCLVCGALLVAFAAVRGDPLGIPSLYDGALLVIYALVSQVFGWLMITSALAQVPVARVGLVLLLQPALSFAWDVLLFNRAFTPLEALGALIALIAIYLGARPAR